MYDPAMSRMAALLLLGIWSCASAGPGPHFSDGQFLRFGVDPNEEASAVIESQKARNYVVAQRVFGRHFSALGFMDKGGKSSAVRILTVRGIVIALDSRDETPVGPAVRYALLAAPFEETHDVDRDGFEEVLVEERSGGGACLRLYRVRDVGFVDPVPIDTRVLGQNICARAASDLNGDGVLELTTEIELTGFLSAAGLDVAPHLQIPLWADQHRFAARTETEAQRSWLRGERARREAELQRARSKLDVTLSYVLGIELAALAHLERADPSAQVGAFDRALAGLVLAPEESAANLRAREKIFTDWNDPSPPPAASEPSRLAARPILTAGAPGEPYLAEGDLLITPDSPGFDPARQQLAISRLTPEFRARARQLGNAAFEARARASTARKAAAEERRRAHEQRLLAAKSPDAATAAAHRQTVADHIAEAQRYAAEAREHGAEAERHQRALEAHKAALYAPE